MSRRKESIEIIARGLLTSRGRVLLCRNIKRGHCYLPGGHVEFGEASTEALAREFREECGLKVKVGELVLCHEQRFRDRNSERHELNLVFHVEHRDIDARTPVRSLERHIEFLWADAGELKRLPILPSVIKRRMPGWLARQPGLAMWQST